MLPNRGIRAGRPSPRGLSQDPHFPLGSRCWNCQIPTMKFVSACLAAGAIIAGTALAQAPANYESGVLLNTTDLLPAELLRGASHRVRDQVATDGFLAHFEIDSDFGTFTAVGVPEARRTIAEFDAIRRLVETSTRLQINGGLGLQQTQQATQ